MMITFLDIVIAGLLMGGIYAIIAVGLSLQYGVARVFNISHGEFIMLGAFGTWILFSLYKVNPIVSLVICGPVLFVIGFVIHKIVFMKLLKTSKTMDIFESKSMLAAFGFVYIIQNIAILLWGSDIKGYSYLNQPVNIAGAVFAANRLVTLLFALIIGLIFYLFLARTRLGKAIRASAQDPTTARLMGININQVLALCFGFGALMAGFAGTLLSLCFSIKATMGLEYAIIAIIVVVLGGLGSIIGSFIGGFLLGIIGSIATYVQPSSALIAYYVIFVLLLLARPKGIMGK